eukprot:TRINITY_DN3833_c0_g1_i1.p1 TRINITY_DN3833_c0_g1~~TRINITY_DN3833_c0_g1_i1.p1  ORF type:complete len:700 (-),score=125.22 TRINITY_DN3833_c0_g1_i1:409-2508(-)
MISLPKSNFIQFLQFHPYSNMTQNSSRRILTFPAVHPSEDVSPAVLLQAVINICRIISTYSSKSFPSHNRIAREAIREIGSLLILFEETQDHGSILTESVVLCLSEIYVYLQKIQFLLEDCTREGARLWVLVQSKRVVDEFQLLIRSIATALDLLPLASMDVCVEVREMVELVAKQARKVKIGIDPDDKQTSMDVHLILSQFEKKIVPNSSDLKRLVTRLGIRSWTDCNREIRFLEEEMERENSKENERRIMLLSILVGFMNYCRGVLFDVVDGPNVENTDIKYDSKMLDCLNPEDFRCPISLELMTDPVIITTGQTYDRSSIQKWLKAGNLSCPKTGEKLKSTELIPNLALQNLIQQFLRNSGVTISEPGSRSHDLRRTHVTRSSASGTEAMRMLAIFLVEKLSTGTEAERNKAAYEIRLLTKSNTINRDCLVEAGAILWLLNLVSSKNPITQHNTMAALLNLSKHSKGKTLIFESGGLDPIIAVLRNGLKMEARHNAAATLFYLASIDEYREAIGEIPESLLALVGLLRDGTDRGKKNAAVALFVLLRFPGNHQRAIAAGAIPALMNLLTSDREDVVNDSLSVLAALAEGSEGSNAVLREIEISSIVKMLISATSSAVKEHCISILVSLCVNGGPEVVSDTKKMPSLVQSLCLLLKEGTRMSRKANLLLGILHDRRKRSSTGMLVSSIRQEHVIHVQ